MMRFLIISLLTLLCALPSLACGYTDPVERYYIFYMPEDTDCYHKRITEGLALVWSDLLQTPITASDIDYVCIYDPLDEEYTFSKIISTAKEKRMQDVIDYLSLLYQYKNHGKISYNKWNYPTAEQIAQQKAILQEIGKRAEAYKDSRLANQYHLLLMRTAFTQKDWKRCHEIYDKYINQAKGTIFADMMDDLYAGVLYREGKNIEAFTIYSRLGDHQSASWCAARVGDLKVIQDYYLSDPNSPALPPLLGEFCNNLQETCDALYYYNLENTDTDGNPSVSLDRYLKNSLEQIAAQNISTKETAKFVAFAEEAAKNPAVRDPGLWYAAAALAQYYIGNYEDAAALLKKGEKSRCSSNTAKRLQYIAIFINMANEKSDSKSDSLAADYLKNLSYDTSESQLHSQRMMRRLLRTTMIPRFEANGDYQKYLASYALLTSIDNMPEITSDVNYGDNSSWYENEYFNALNETPIEELIKWRNNVSNTDTADPWLALVSNFTYGQETYLDDIIGTRLMRQGKFEEALEYLDRVPVTFISRQMISPYMATRKYDTMPWREPRPKVDAKWFVTLNTNPKADYCRYVLDLQKRAGKSSATRADMCALAAAYINATPHGNCWWLTLYGTSMYDMPELEANDKNFADDAKTLLDKALTLKPEKGISDAELLYAKTYLFNITSNRFSQWDWEKNKDVYNFEADKNHTYMNLAHYIKSHPNENYPSYISNCDIINAVYTPLSLTY